MSHLSVQALISDSFVFARENMVTALRLGWPVMGLTVASSFVQPESQVMLGFTLMVLSFIAGTMLLVGLYRCALYGRVEPLQFKATEARVMATSLLIAVLMLLTVGVVAGSVLLTGVAGLVGAGLQGGSSPAASVLAAAVIVSGSGFCTWLMVRLIAAVPATIDQGRVMVLQSLAMTRGQFWPIFSAVLVIILTAVLAALVAAALVLVVMLLGGLSVDGFASKDPKQAMDALAATPWTEGLYGILNGALDVVIITPLMVGLASSVYRQCAGVADPVNVSVDA